MRWVTELARSWKRERDFACRMESARIIPSRAFQIIQISGDDDQSKQLGSVRQQQGTGHGIARHLSGVTIRLSAVSDGFSADEARARGQELINPIEMIRPLHPRRSS